MDCPLCHAKPKTDIYRTIDGEPIYICSNPDCEQGSYRNEGDIWIDKKKVKEKIASDRKRKPKIDLNPKLSIAKRIDT